jgi:hypothetical protein
MLGGLGAWPPWAVLHGWGGGRHSTTVLQDPGPHNLAPTGSLLANPHTGGLAWTRGNRIWPYMARLTPPQATMPHRLPAGVPVQQTFMARHPHRGMTSKERVGGTCFGPKRSQVATKCQEWVVGGKSPPTPPQGFYSFIPKLSGKNGFLPPTHQAQGGWRPWV